MHDSADRVKKRGSELINRNRLDLHLLVGVSSAAAAGFVTDWEESEEVPLGPEISSSWDAPRSHLSELLTVHKQTQSCWTLPSRRRCCSRRVECVSYVRTAFGDDGDGHDGCRCRQTKKIEGWEEEEGAVSSLSGRRSCARERNGDDGDDGLYVYECEEDDGDDGVHGDC